MPKLVKIKSIFFLEGWLIRFLIFLEHFKLFYVFREYSTTATNDGGTGIDPAGRNPRVIFWGQFLSIFVLEALDWLSRIILGVGLLWREVVCVGADSNG